VYCVSRNGRPCRELPCKLAWDNTFSLTERQKGSYTSQHPRVKRTATKAFTILSCSAAADASADDEYRNFVNFIANNLRNYFPRTRYKVQNEMSHTNQGLFDVSYPVSTPLPGSQVSFPTSPSTAAGSEDVILSVNYSSVIKSTQLYISFVFQPVDFMCKTVCTAQYTNFYLYVFHHCRNNSLTHFMYNTTNCLLRNL
jgi:hypothetical protein